MLQAQMNMPLIPLPDDLNAKLSEIEKRVLKLLPIGKANAITGHELAVIINVDERTIGSIVKRLRLKHCDVGSSRSSDHYGYYRFKDANEYLEYMEKATRENAESAKVLDAMRFTPIANTLTTSLNNKEK